MMGAIKVDTASWTIELSDEKQVHLTEQKVGVRKFNDSEIKLLFMTGEVNGQLMQFLNRFWDDRWLFDKQTPMTAIVRQYGKTEQRTWKYTGILITDTIFSKLTEDSSEYADVYVMMKYAFCSEIEEYNHST